MQMTDRQREIKELLDKGRTAPEIAKELEISRNAVYQQIQRMRRNGVLPATYTPTGAPAREITTAPGQDTLTKLLSSEVDMVGKSVETASAAASLALVQELRRTRDELDAIAQRLSMIIPR